MTGRALCSRGPHRGCGSLPGFIVLAVLVVWIPQASAQINFTIKKIRAQEGETVTLKPFAINPVIEYYEWFQGTQTNHDYSIIYFGSNSKIRKGRKYTGRETGLSNGGLQISNVLRNDTGDYTIKVLFSTGSSQVATIQLTVNGAVAPHAPATAMMALFILFISSFL